MESENVGPIPSLEPKILVDLLPEVRQKKVVLIDSRSALDFNERRIDGAINLPSSNLMKRRLEQNKVTVLDLLHLKSDFLENVRCIVFCDNCSQDFDEVKHDSILYMTVQRLISLCRDIRFLKGGFQSFLSVFPDLCLEPTDKPSPSLPSPHTCIPVIECGPTEIFPNLYLGSQKDALSVELLKTKGINYVLNVSHNCPKAPCIKDENFLRICVNDNFSDKLSAHFLDAFHFLEKVRNSNGCALVHCLAGVSRSPTLIIAYLMQTNQWTYEEAYRYVKERRPSIAPNLNFLGQLMEFDRVIREQKERELEIKQELEKAVMEQKRREKELKHHLSPISVGQSCGKRQRLKGIRYTSNGLGLNLSVLPRVGFETVREDGSPSISGIRRLSLSSD